MSKTDTGGTVPPGASRLSGRGLFDWAALFDLLLVVAILVVVKQTMLPVSQLYAGPVSTLSAMIVATLLLRRRGLGWRALGLAWPESWRKTIGLSVLAFGTLLLTAGLMQPVAGYFFEDIGTSGRFDHVEGNGLAYLIMMLMVWTHAAFFEELLFRAFIINRSSRFLGGGIRADIGAAVFSAVFFGYRHYYYQGMNGALITGAIGFSFALLYLWFGRKNILPLVFAHGTADTLGITARFLGLKGD